MTNDILQDNLYWNLLQVSMRAKHSLIRLAEQDDLTIMQLYTLCSMEKGQPMSMNSISCILSCDASNVTGIVERLFTQHLIVREESLKDRRLKMITLTPQGEVLRDKILAELQAHESSTLDSLSQAQKQQLLVLVQTALQAPVAVKK